MARHVARGPRRAPRAWVLILALAALGTSAAPAQAQQPGNKAEPGKSKFGVVLNDSKAFQGYTLFSPVGSKNTYLIDMEGRVVRKWETDCAPACCAYLLPNGNLLRPGTLGREGQSFGPGPAAGGRVQEFTWDGELVWDFKLLNDKQMPNHDITPMPNGNVLLIVWDKKTREEAIAAGRKKELVGDYLLPDSIVEVKKTGKTTGKVVWEWHIWDHLIQDHDKTKANYGNVGENPGRIDVNYTQDVLGQLAKGKDADKLKGIGYVASPTAKKQRVNPDWTHMNSVAYNAELDQIVLSVHTFNEIWIIDHSTTAAEAASSKGGRSGKGGDLLYRWGNPRTYRQGTAKDQKLFGQHTAHWIPKGYPGEGRMMLFNNGMRRPDGAYSSVEELVLPADGKGGYVYKPGSPFGPESQAWVYTAAKKTDFYSMVISGAERLPNGNTLICAGTSGTVFEVNPEKETVWKYVHPSRGMSFGPGGFPPKGPGGFGPPFGAPAQGFQVLPGFIQDRLELTAEQKAGLGKLQKETEGKLDKLLTDEQKKQMRDPKSGFRFAGVPRPGELMTSFQQARLKLSDDQKKGLTGLQKEVDAGLNDTLTEKQRKQLKELRDSFGRIGFGPPGGFAPPGGGSLFRVYRYGQDYAGLRGRDLTPGKTVEELERRGTK